MPTGIPSSKRLVSFLAGVIISAGCSTLFASAQETVPCTPPAGEVVTPAATPPAADAGTPTDPAPEAQTTSSAAHAPIAELRLYELLPNPVGDDAQEFIEIQNVGSSDADLAGWSIVDGSGKRFSFGSGMLATESSTYMLYAETKLRLANTAGHLELVAPDGSVVDQVSYVSPVPEGKSFARFDDGWQWTSRITPGAENDPEPVVSPPTSTPAPATVPVVTPTVPEAPATATITTTIAPSAAPADVRVVFSATQPNPDGADDHEWFELRNDGTSQAVLDGWHVMDAGGGSFALTGISIEAGAVRRFDKTAFKFSLNNDTEELRLLDPSGASRDSVQYLNAPSGATYVRGASGWSWMTGNSPTTSGAVAATTDAAEADVSDPPNMADGGSADADDVPLAELDSLEDGTDITVHGVVTLPPGVVGKTTFAIRDLSDEIGVYVRAYGRDAIPQLAAGDPVSIGGKIKKDGSLHINTNGKSIVRDGAAVRLPKAERDVTQLDANDDGLAVTVNGLVAARGKRWITLSDDAAAREVTARVMKGEAPAAKSGDTVILTGVVRAKGDVLELIVADAGAIAITPATDAVAPADAAPEKTKDAGADAVKDAIQMPLGIPVPAGTPFAAGTAAALVVAGGGAYFWWRNRREDWGQELSGNLEGEGLVDR